jgi:hypothetical protein
MSQRKYSVTYKKKVAEAGDKKYVYPKIGIAFETPSGNIDVIISALPLNWDGKVKLLLNREEVQPDEISE